MSYYRANVTAARDKIAAACPDVVFEYGDYGFRLDGYKRGAGGETIVSSIRTIMQPERPADPDLNFDGQPEIIGDVDTLIREWSKCVR